MNTHPTHTQVGGWGLWPMIVHTGIGFFVDCCVCFFGASAWEFLLVLGCVWWMFFVLKYSRYLGTLRFIFTYIILESETLKSQA